MSSSALWTMMESTLYSYFTVIQKCFVLESQLVLPPSRQTNSCCSFVSPQSGAESEFDPVEGHAEGLPMGVFPMFFGYFVTDEWCERLSTSIKRWPKNVRRDLTLSFIVNSPAFHKSMLQHCAVARVVPGGSIVQCFSPVNNISSPISRTVIR
jgi:hypothetical protein